MAMIDPVGLGSNSDYSPSASEDFELTARERAELRREILKMEIELLRVRVVILKDHALVAATEGVKYANASARAQLATRPWTKLGVLAASAFLATTTFRRIAPGPIVSAATPLLIQFLSNNIQNRL